MKNKRNTMTRSENMARIKSKNTKPEIFLENFFGTKDTDTDAIIKRYLESLTYI